MGWALMQVLLSAYACEPNKGSEPAVGWNWVRELSRRGIDVTVITRANNRPSIEAAPSLSGVRFIYVDTVGRRLTKVPFGVYGYYVAWQLAALHAARKAEAANTFDYVHHVTFVSARLPSFMGELN